MIIKSTSQTGTGLAAHLLNTEDGNEQVSLLGGRHVIDNDVHQNIYFWLSEAKGTRLQKPLQHVAIAPDHKVSEEEWQKIWFDYEQEFGLEDAPFVEVEHLKKGKPHRHRVYRRFGDDGKAFDMGRSRMRQEKLARRLEIDLGHQLQQGKHSRAVMSALVSEGRDDAARVIAGHGHDTAPPPIPDMTGSEWQQEARGVSLEAAREALLRAWQSSDTPESFRAAVDDEGLTLARGKKAVVAVDPAGDTHPVMRAINATKEVRLRKRDLDSRLEGLQLQDATDVIEQQRQAQRDAVMDAAAAATDPEPTTKEAPAPVPTMPTREQVAEAVASGSTQPTTEIDRASQVDLPDDAPADTADPEPSLLAGINEHADDPHQDSDLDPDPMEVPASTAQDEDNTVGGFAADDDATAPEPTPEPPPRPKVPTRDEARRRALAASTDKAKRKHENTKEDARDARSFVVSAQNRLHDVRNRPWWRWIPGAERRAERQLQDAKDYEERVAQRLQKQLDQIDEKASQIIERAQAARDEWDQQYAEPVPQPESADPGADAPEPGDEAHEHPFLHDHEHDRVRWPDNQHLGVHQLRQNNRVRWRKTPDPDPMGDDASEESGPSPGMK